jgi:hypothetical protein
MCIGPGMAHVGKSSGRQRVVSKATASLQQISPFDWAVQLKGGG